MRSWPLVCMLASSSTRGYTRMPAHRHRMLWHRVGRLLVVATLAAVAHSTSFAQTTKPGAIDKTVNLIVGMPPGGSVDAYARLIQRHLTRFVKGVPTIVVQNKPGAGSLLSVMAVANSPPADGVALGTFSSSLIPDAVAEPDHFRIDFRHFGFIRSEERRVGKEC